MIEQDKDLLKMLLKRADDKELDTISLMVENEQLGREVMKRISEFEREGD